MAINLGSNTISALKLGTTTVDKIYLGSTQIYSDSPGPTPPVVPDYGTVTLYGYISVPYSVSNVVGGTVTIESEDDLDMIFDGSGAISPINIEVSGHRATTPFSWTVTAYDADLNEIWVDPEMLAIALTISPSVLVDFDMTFDLTLREERVDKTTTSTRTLASASEFASLVSDGQGYTLGGTVLTAVVKEVSIGTLITSTPDYFLADFESLDNIDMSNANSLTTIGHRFLGDTPINVPIIIPEGVTSIGGDFLSDCFSFNSNISLPSTLTSIGATFLHQCSAFSKPVVLPSGLTSIGKGFMYGMGDMVSYVDVGSLSTNIMEAQSSMERANVLTYYNSLAPGYSTGIGIKGANRAAWMSLYGNNSNRHLVDYGS